MFSQKNVVQRVIRGELGLLLANEKYDGAMSALYDIVWERRVASANDNKVSQ